MQERGGGAKVGIHEVSSARLKDVPGDVQHLCRANEDGYLEKVAFPYYV
jgi:hypothetical protein